MTYRAPVILAFMLAFACTSGYAQDNAGESPAPAMVEGIVTRLGTGEPLQNVRVSFTSETGSSRTATTGRDGRFQARDLAPGFYTVGMYRDGFARPRRSTEAVNLNLNPGQRIQDLHFQLLPAGVVAGRVFDENSRARSGVSIELLRYRYMSGRRFMTVLTTHAETDDRGEYRFPGIEPGEYYIRASPNTTAFKADGGFAPVYYPGVTDPQYATTVAVASGAEIHAIDFVLTARDVYSVRVKLLLPASVPATATPRFYVIPRNRRVTESSAVRFGSLGDSTWSANGFSPGTYDIYVYLVVSNQPAVVRFGRITVDVFDQNVDAGTVAILPGVDIPVRIMANDRLPVEVKPGQIRLNLRPLDIPSAFGPDAASILEDGTFILRNVPAGRFEIGLIGLPAGIYLDAARYGARSVLETGISVAGDPPGPLELFLAGPAGTVEGVVWNAKDELVPNSRVVLIPPRNLREMPGAFKVTASDQNGVFRIRNIPPGDYAVLAWEDVEDGAYQDPGFLVEFEGRAARITVDRGSRTTLNMTAIPRSD